MNPDQKELNANFYAVLNEYFIRRYYQFSNRMEKKLNNGILLPKSVEQFIQTVESHNKQQNAFFTCSWRFLKYDKLEQLKFKLEKVIGI